MPLRLSPMSQFEFDEFFKQRQTNVPKYSSQQSQPIVNLYLECLREPAPPASQNIWTAAGESIYITDEFKYMDARIDAAWASRKSRVRKSYSVELRGQPHIGTFSA